MNAPEDLARTYPLGDPCEACVDQPREAAAGGAGGGHDGGLRAGVDEGFDGVSVYFDVYVEHDDGAECFGLLYMCVCVL